MPENRNAFYTRRDAEVGVSEDRWKFLATASVSLGQPSLFYASLRDPLVFETVTGRPLSASQRETAILEGYRLGLVNAGTGYPGLFPAAAGTRLECLVVHDLNRFEQTMVAWYEWDEYVLETVSLADGRTAQVFLPDLDAIQREYGPFEIEPWSFERWQSDSRDRALAHARAWMAQRPSDERLLEAGFCVQQELPGNRRATG